MRGLTKTLLGVGVATGLAAAAAIGASAPAAAQGFYFNAPGIHIGVGRPHHRYYGRRYYNYAPGYYGCPQYYSMQDGVCKPYRGY
jgi:hypothetical protein